MGIDSESDVAADLQIGPTELGMVRIYISGEGFELPMDFDPDEAEEIAAELLAAAERARKSVSTAGPGQRTGPGRPRSDGAPRGDGTAGGRRRGGR